MIENISRKLYEQGLVPGKSGNVSYRFSKDMIGITPSGFSLGTVNWDKIIIVDSQGNIISGNDKPSSELAMHLAIYQKREDVNGIVHTHPPYTTGFAHAKRKIKRMEGFGKLKDQFFKNIDYEKPGSNELAQKAALALCDENVLILEDHGLITIGENLEEAALLTEFVENVAKTNFITLLLSKK